MNPFLMADNLGMNEHITIKSSAINFRENRLLLAKINVNDPKSFINQCYQMAHAITPPFKKP